MAEPQDYSKYLQEQATPASNNDPFNYEAFRKQVSDTSASTREVGGINDDYGGAYKLYKAVKHTGDKIQRGAARAAIGQARVQQDSLRKQAESAATGIEMMGAGMETYMKRLQEAQDFTSAAYQSSAENWDAAAEKADEYVQASRDRVSVSLATLDRIHNEIGENRDFAKAHSLQAGTQAVLGSMKTEQRNILTQYGANSAEYQQFYQSKQVALATVQSNIHTLYQQFQEQADQTFLAATNEAQVKHNMYVGFQEQQHVEMVKFAEESKYGYALQKAQFDVGVEQLRMSGMENWANWIIETPTFSYDAMPLINMLLNISNAGKPSFLEQMGTAAVGGIAGGLTGGIAGGLAGGIATGLAQQISPNKKKTDKPKPERYSGIA